MNADAYGFYLRTRHVDIATDKSSQLRGNERVIQFKPVEMSVSL